MEGERSGEERTAVTERLVWEASGVRYSGGGVVIDDRGGDRMEVSCEGSVECCVNSGQQQHCSHWVAVAGWLLSGWLLENKFKCETGLKFQ